MANIVGGERSSFTILEPLFQWLIATNLHFPCLWVNTNELLGGVNSHFTKLFVVWGNVGDFLDGAIATYREFYACFSGLEQD